MWRRCAWYPGCPFLGFGSFFTVFAFGAGIRLAEAAKTRQRVEGTGVSAFEARLQAVQHL